QPYGGSAATTWWPAFSRSSPVRRAAASKTASTLPAPGGGFVETATRSACDGGSTFARSGRPANTAKASATSSTVVPSGPLDDRPHQSLRPDGVVTTPVPGLIPNRPHAADGMRIDPPPSLPWAI